jgi:hypothetical protein
LEEKAWSGSSRARKGLALVEALRGVSGVFRRFEISVGGCCRNDFVV